MIGTSHHSCDRCPNTTPMFFTYSFLFFHGVYPLIAHVPDVGVSMPLMIFIVVLLPAPFGPMYPTMSPSSMSNDTLFRALMILYFLLKKFFRKDHFPFCFSGTLNCLQMSLNSMIFVKSTSF